MAVSTYLLLLCMASQSTVLHSVRHKVRDVVAAVVRVRQMAHRLAASCGRCCTHPDHNACTALQGHARGKLADGRRAELMISRGQNKPNCAAAFCGFLSCR